MNKIKNENEINSEKIKLFTNSDFYWDKYWSKIDKAKDFIFMITYDIDNKMIANLTFRKLMDALDRGVRVIILVEDLNFYARYSNYKQLKKKGAIFIKPNPTSLIFDHMYNGQFRRFYMRCHQKVSLIDKDLFIGSINAADEYSHFKYGSAKFVDWNIYVKNTVCFKKVLNFFREFVDQNLHQVKKVQQVKILNELFSTHLKDYQQGKNDFEIFEEFLEENPLSKTEIQDNLYDLLDSSKESITIIQAYYSNLEKIEKALIRAIERGVKVKIITSEKRDQSCYRYQYNNDLFEHLLKNGVEVYEFLDKYLHTKAYYIDNKFISMGSLNNDRTSFIMNNEANYLIKKNQTNQQFFEDFDRSILNLEKNCRKVDLNAPKDPFRFGFSYWWYFFLWFMEFSSKIRMPKYYDV